LNKPATYRRFWCCTDGQIISQHPNWGQVEVFPEGRGNLEPMVASTLDSSLTADAMGNNEQCVLVRNFQDLAGTHGAFAIPVQLLTGMIAGFSTVRLSAPIQV
jgi:hypothetical protein